LWIKLRKNASYAIFAYFLIVAVIFLIARSKITSVVVIAISAFDFVGYVLKSGKKADLLNCKAEGEINPGKMAKLLISEQLTESIPQFFLQILNSVLTKRMPTQFQWIKMALSLYLAVSGSYMFVYHRIIKRKDWNDIPVGIISKLKLKLTSRKSSHNESENSVDKTSNVPTNATIVGEVEALARSFKPQGEKDDFV
jgi:hypothetical protein